MKRITIISIAAALILGLAAVIIGLNQGATTALDATPTPSSCPAINAGDVVELINIERAKANVAPLSEVHALDQAALLKGMDMQAKHYYAHNAPDGTTPWHWFGAAGYQYRDAAENLASTQPTAADAVAAWMKSPGHRANILNPAYTETGVFIACGSFTPGENQPTNNVLIQEFGGR